MSIIKKIKDKLYWVKQLWVSLFIYPTLREHDTKYNRYWHERKLSAKSLNEFQQDRANLALRYLEAGSSIMDIGAGNGAVLLDINKRKPMRYLIGVDISDDALRMIRENGINGIHADISMLAERQLLPPVDYIFLFEVIEHTPSSEDLLNWAFSNARKGVFFSVPNTGFISHRLRLLFGKFPLQWRAHPSEHVRFWTLRDMRWWLSQLNYQNYQLIAYQGIPFLKRIQPSLAAQGLFVFIPKR
ncbi:MAG: class I SAM-dependent methyltransferase [Patescibacteria group bacterium]